jgi:glycosyltransferase involved in cell wall biosynthesis
MKRGNYILVGDFRVYRYASQTLKFFIVRRDITPRKFIAVYFSELAPELGLLSPFLNSELYYINRYADLALFGGSRKFTGTCGSLLAKPAIFLPLSAFVDLNRFFPRSTFKKYDICFYSPFKDGDMERKGADLFLEILETNKNLSGVWIGGYDCQEKWKMENAFNSAIRKYNIPINGKLNTNMLWEKDDFFKYGWFSQAKWKEQKEIFQKRKKEIMKRKIELDLSFGLDSLQVIRILSQSRSALILSKGSGCLRFMMEALAMNVPVVAPLDFNASHDFINRNTGINCIRDVREISKGIEYVLNNQNSFSPRDWFSKEWGLKECTLKLIRFLEEIGLKYDAIYSLPFILEILLRRAIKNLKIG